MLIIMNEQLDKIYRTSDFVLASTLHYLGHEIKESRPVPSNPGRKEFLFAETEELRKNVKQYWNAEIRVEPMKFNSSQYVIKDHIHRNFN